MRLALRVTPFSAASAQDVTLSSATERRGFTLNVDVTAVDANLELLRIDCTGQRGSNQFDLQVFDLQALQSLYGVDIGQTRTVQKPVALVTESPLRDVPLTLSCEGRGTSGGVGITTQVSDVVPLSVIAAIPYPACVESSTTVCLQGGRFQASVAFIAPDGVERNASVRAAPLTPDRGLFWFFDSNQLELTIQVLNQCGVNNRYWVFAGGPTPFGVRATVTDTRTGQRRVYSNPQNREALEYRDQQAFATCP